MAKPKRPWKERVRNFIWPKMGIRRYVFYLKNKILRLTASPHAVAAGFASGAAVSMFPAIGFHFILAFILAFVVRGNILAAAIGTAVGNPLTFPFIFSLTYQLGSVMARMLGLTEILGAPAAGAQAGGVPQGMLSASLDVLLPAIKVMTLGGVPVSIVCFFVFYVLIHQLVSRFQDARRARLARKREASTREATTSRENESGAGEPVS